MEIELPPDQPDNVVVFRKRDGEQVAVDLREPFFKERPRDYTKCDHTRRGVEYDLSERKVYCKCGEQIDPFDALLIYAHAERRLIHHAESIKEHERKEQEKKDRRPFVREHSGYAAFYAQGNKRVLGYMVNLKCGHSVRWYKGKRRHSSPPRSMTCDACYRAWELEQRGVKTVDGAKAGAFTNV